MKVYTLNVGQHSDRRVVGIFGDRSKALEAQGKIGNDLPSSINEFSLDELVGAEWGPTWSATIDLLDGRIGGAEEDETLRLPEKCKIEWYLDGGRPLAIVHSPISEDHARSVAAETWREYLGERSGPKFDT